MLRLGKDSEHTTLGQQDACRHGRPASAMSKPHKGMSFRPAMPCFTSLISSSWKPDTSPSAGQQAGSWYMPWVQCSREWLYRAGMFLGSPAERTARILLPKQPSAGSLLFSFPGNFGPGWGGVGCQFLISIFPRECTRTNLHTHGSRTTFIRLKLVSGKDFHSSPSTAGYRPPLPLGVCKRHSRSPATGLAKPRPAALAHSNEEGALGQPSGTL